MARTNGLVYAVIKERIKVDTKNLPPDTRLPARIKLMETYKVARSSIEKAIAELVGEGYLLMGSAQLSATRIMMSPNRTAISEVL